MKFVQLSSEYGIVVRRSALDAGGVSREALLRAMEASRPLDEDETLVSFGPHFGEEAAAEFTRRLESLGLVYVDDFFVFSGDFPVWCRFGASLKL
jgi:hypothetical protein